MQRELVNIVLEELCTLNGASGDEKAVREFIIEQIKDYCNYTVDNLGSVIAFKKGRQIPKRKLMFCAHMDEVGFIITDISDDGYLGFNTVGGIDTKTVCDRVISVNGIKGVVGLKPVHLQDENEGKKAPDIKDLFIDIGAASKEDAEKYVSLGDFAYFSDEYTEYENGFIRSKALDDRIGCMLMIELIKSDLYYDAWFCFNVQEEVGLRGAFCTSYQVKPDIAFVLEATTASDLCSVTGGDRVCVLGNGPVISFMDGRTVYDRGLYDFIFKLACNAGIDVQSKTRIAGGNDAGAVQTSAGGCRVAAISLACRYIHCSSSVVMKSDIEKTRALLKLIIKESDRII